MDFNINYANETDATSRHGYSFYSDSPNDLPRSINLRAYHLIRAVIQGGYAGLLTPKSPLLQGVRLPDHLTKPLVNYRSNRLEPS
jgi:hypothetical protein